MHKLTKKQCDELTLELQELVLRVFSEDGKKIARYHTDQELKRLDEISEILKNCEIVD